MKRIIILGAEGNLGRQLSLVFGNDAEYEVIGWGRTDIDITDRELILKKINDLKPAIIINTAAYNAVDKCENDDKEYDLAKKINIDGPRNLAEAALAVKATLVHYSTDYVFAGENELGYKETDEPSPINRYGKTKFHGEKQLLALSGQGLKWYLIRTSKLFGPRGTSSNAKPSFFDIMIDLSKAKTEIEVVDEEASCFTYTPDLAKSTKELIESGKGSGIYHLVNSDPCTWYEAARYLFKSIGSDIKVIPVSADKFPRPARRPKFSVLKNTKFNELRNWKEALDEYLKVESL